MVKLYDNTSGVLLGEITPEQLQFLIDQLEEESLEDKDYAITPMTLAYFQELGADTDLVKLLSQALGAKDELVIRWARP
jgi:processive 1,2-diacylglycerol beta-glucosyltransferase